jgi:hypothetical protein
MRENAVNLQDWFSRLPTAIWLIWDDYQLWEQYWGICERCFRWIFKPFFAHIRTCETKRCLINTRFVVCCLSDTPLLNHPSVIESQLGCWSRCTPSQTLKQIKIEAEKSLPTQAPFPTRTTNWVHPAWASKHWGGVNRRVTLLGNDALIPRASTAPDLDASCSSPCGITPSLEKLLNITSILAGLGAAHDRLSPGQIDFSWSRWN